MYKYFSKFEQITCRKYLQNFYSLSHETCFCLLFCPVHLVSPCPPTRCPQFSIVFHSPVCTHPPYLLIFSPIDVEIDIKLNGPGTNFIPALYNNHTCVSFVWSLDFKFRSCLCSKQPECLQLHLKTECSTLHGWVLCIQLLLFAFLLLSLEFCLNFCNPRGGNVHTHQKSVILSQIQSGSEWCPSVAGSCLHLEHVIKPIKTENVTEQQNISLSFSSSFLTKCSKVSRKLTHL